MLICIADFTRGIHGLAIDAHEQIARLHTGHLSRAGDTLDQQSVAQARCGTLAGGQRAQGQPEPGAASPSERGGSLVSVRHRRFGKLGGDPLLMSLAPQANLDALARSCLSDRQWKIRHDIDRLFAHSQDHIPRAKSSALRRAERRQRFAQSRPWQAASRWPGTAFSFVETAGFAYLGKMGQWLRPKATARAQDDLDGLPLRLQTVCRPVLMGMDTDAKVALARKVLHAMGLEQHLAPLVLLVGHGSQSENNAHAAALDCGACSGQTGEVNARVFARLLNEVRVRKGLRAQGHDIPTSTRFLAALHNTTTDEIEGLDLDLLPPQARACWDRLQPVLAEASARVRKERAPSLGIDPKLSDPQLLNTLRRRASDGAQTRPEWGLAGNAAFVIGPRHRTQGVLLNGRSFLHDYDATQDTDGSVLELLMTAPMLVTHWINWQYHASTCDPERLGSGNKVLHNVVGGAHRCLRGERRRPPHWSVPSIAARRNALAA